MESSVDRRKSSSEPNPVPFDLRSFELQINVQALRAPVAIACETEHSGRHLQEGSRGICSDSLDPGGGVRGWSVACTIRMSDIAYFVLIIEAGRYIGFLEQKNVFQSGVLWVRRAAEFSGVMIGTQSLFCFRATACNFQAMPHTAHRGSLLKK